MILVVGDKPSKCTDPKIPFKGAKCEKRLKEWLKKILDDGETYLIINQNDPGLAVTLALVDIFKTPIIALGNKASEALKTKAHFKLPHPSGLNRQINNKKFIDQCLRDCYSYIHEGDPNERRP